MIDKRKLKRRQLIYYLKVVNRKNGELVGRLVDITTEGLMLLSDEELEKNVEYRLKMILPQEMRGDREIVFDARSVYSKPDVNPNFFVTGFRLIRIDDEDVGLIDELIQDYELPN